MHLFIVASYLHFGDAFLECSFSKEREMINLGSLNLHCFTFQLFHVLLFSNLPICGVCAKFCSA